MTRRWIGVAWIASCLAATPLWAGDPGPEPTGCGANGSSNVIPGPLAPPYAPEGPPNDLSLPNNINNAFMCDVQCPPCCPRVYADLSYLAWWFKNQAFPPLVTASPSVTANAGSLADTTAVPVITDSSLKYRNPFSGGRVTLGYYLDDHQTSAFEASGFIVGQGSANATALSTQAMTGIRILASPFTNFQTAAPAALQYGFPGTLVGGVTQSLSARLFGGEANFVCNYPDCCVCGVPLPFSFLFGARYLNLDERLNLNSFSGATGTGTLTFDGTPIVPATQGAPAVINAQDSFHTRNQFYGGQAGARVGWSFGHWFVGGQGKIAVGNVQEQSYINGYSTLSLPGQLPISVPGHLYAVGSNIGTYTHNAFAYVPEGEARIGFRFNANFLLYASYNFLYINKVARPGDQIDTTVDLRQVPVSANFQRGFVATQPAALPITQSTFWAQGVNVGFEITY